MAGEKPWPKLWHNMRASRQTELLNEFPVHVACGWIGNSRAVAMRHYAMTTDEHFAKATSTPDPNHKAESEAKGEANTPGHNKTAFQ